MTNSSVGASCPMITSTLAKFSNPSPPQISESPGSPNPNDLSNTPKPSILTR
jgi:hypothetical protein